MRKDLPRVYELKIWILQSSIARVSSMKNTYSYIGTILVFSLLLEEHPLGGMLNNLGTTCIPKDTFHYE